MSAYATIEALDRIARAPTIDDAQLDTLVAALSSMESYVDQEDGGYGSTYTRTTEVMVRDAAEAALRVAGEKVLARLPARYAAARGDVRAALGRVIAGARAAAWATLTPSARADAVAQLDDPEVRALVALRVDAIDGADGAERAIVDALVGGSEPARAAARDAIGVLRPSATLGARLVDVMLACTGPPAYEVGAAIERAGVRLEAASRRRLAEVVDDAALGDTACGLLAPYLGDAGAEAEVAIAARVLPAIARACARSEDEGTWRRWIERCGRGPLAAALIAPIRANLEVGRVRGDELRHMALLGRALAPIAPALVRYLDPTTAPSGRHVHLAVMLAGAIAAPEVGPALVWLLDTEHQYEALLALAAIGPEVAGIARGAIEGIGYVRSSRPETLVREARAAALVALGQAGT